MNLLTLLLVIAVLVLIFGNPHIGPHVYQGYSYGYWPSGLGLIVVVVVLLVLLTR